MSSPERNVPEPLLFHGGMTEFELVERFGIERYVAYTVLAETAVMPGVDYSDKIEWAIHTDASPLTDK